MTWARRRVILVVAVAIAVISIGALAAVLLNDNGSRVIHSTGTLVTYNIGVYWNENLTSPVIQVNWSVLLPGDTAIKNMYLVNQLPVNATLYTNTTLWAPPEAEQYLTYSWNYSGQIVQPGETIPVQLILDVAYNVYGSNITDFSFDIIMGAEEVLP